jgi:hypothetical protein
VDFILRILFSGLIAFVPSEDGKELTVLLVNVDHGYHVSDGTELVHHQPLLLARGGNCSGDCPTRDAAVAEFLFADKSSEAALDSLEQAVSGGAAWQLAGSDLSVRKGCSRDPELPPLVLRDNVRNTIDGVPQAIPTSAREREDYSWLASLTKVCPSGCTLNPAVLSAQPPAGLIAARLRLRSGKVFTYSVARLGSNITPVNFRRLDGAGAAAPYTQAIASWVGADIRVSGETVEIVEEKFAGGPGRAMSLAPVDGKVEIAVLNLPPFVPPASSNNDAPEVGKHFEVYYELAQTPPDRASRLVPRVGAAPGTPAYPAVDWQLVHPREVLWSDLLNKVRLDSGRSIYDRVICPMVGYP